MTESDDNNYPEWITSAFKKKNTCTTCKAALTLEDLVSIGLYTPQEISDLTAGPMAGFDVRCAYCGHVMKYAFDLSLGELFPAIESFYDVIVRYRMGGDGLRWSMLPSPNQKKKKNEVPAHNDKFGLNEARIKRVRRDPALQQMPTDKEVQVFLNKLNRTSMKRSSKSFKRFMVEMRVDLDLPGKGDKS